MTFVPLPLRLDADTQRPVVSDEWRQMVSWAWRPGTTELHALIAAFVAAADPGTVGQIRTRVMDSNVASPPYRVGGPTGSVRAPYIPLPDTTGVGADGVTSVVLEARRISGAIDEGGSGGGIWIYEVAAVAAPAATVESPPSFLYIPAIEGAAVAGLTLKRIDALADGFPMPTVVHQWLRNGNPIAGANDETLVLDPSWVGSTISIQAVATNALGSEQAFSLPTTPISVAGAALAPENITVGGGLDGSQVDLSGSVNITGTFTSTTPNDVSTGVAISFRVNDQPTERWIDLATGQIVGSEYWNDLRALNLVGVQTFTVTPGIFSNGYSFTVRMAYRGLSGVDGPYSVPITVTGVGTPSAPVLLTEPTLPVHAPAVGVAFTANAGEWLNSTTVERQWEIAPADSAIDPDAILLPDGSPLLSPDGDDIEAPPGTET